MEKKINYFENPGSENTEKLIELVKERKEELGIENIVVASVTGKSSVEVSNSMPDANIISITHHAGFRGEDELELQQELRLFSQGVKVCVEISIMAADAGLIPTDKEVIALGGTAEGVDTAMVLKPAHMGNFFDLRINEIIAMPRP